MKEKYLEKEVRRGGQMEGRQHGDGGKTFKRTLTRIHL